MSDIKSASIHEAGHIVIAYFVGFPIDEVCVNSQGDGITKIDFGELNAVATPLISMDICPQFHHYLNELNSEPLINLGKRICMILVAGDLAEDIYKNGKNNGKITLGVSGIDLSRFEAIGRYLKIDFEEILKDIYRVLSNDIVWNSIIALSDSIINNENSTLDKDEIFNSLSNSKFFDFIENN